jgi:hypothetical protein
VDISDFLCFDGGLVDIPDFLSFGGGLVIYH